MRPFLDGITREMNYLKRTVMTSKVTMGSLIGIYYFVISKRSDVGLLTSIFNLFKIVNSFFTIGRLSLFMTFYDRKLSN